MDEKNFLSGVNEQQQPPQQPQKKKGGFTWGGVFSVIVSLIVWAGVKACNEENRSNNGNFSGFTIQRINDYGELGEALKRDPQTRANVKRDFCAAFEKNNGLKLDAAERKELGERSWKVFLQYALPKIEVVVPILCREKGISEQKFFKEVNKENSAVLTEAFFNEMWERIGQIPEVSNALETMNREYYAWLLQRHPEYSNVLQIKTYRDLADVLKQDPQLKANVESDLCAAFEANSGLKLDAEERKELGKRVWRFYLQYAIPKIEVVVPVLCREKGISEQKFFKEVNKENSTVTTEAFFNEMWERISQIPEVSNAFETMDREYCVWLLQRHPELQKK